jgi:Zn-dependent peptidase ImmA (M78 family)
MPSLNANRGAKRAREARAELGLGDGPLDCVVEAVERRGGVPVLAFELPDRVAGAYDPSGPRVIVNQREAVARQRFTVAHEFGHHRLGHDDIKIIDSPADLAGQAPRNDWREVEANAFAAEFLAPVAGVRAWWERAGARVAGLEEVCRLAAAFGMSAPAAAIRLSTAGLADRQRAERLRAEVEEGLHRDVAAMLDVGPARDDALQRAADAGRVRLPDDLRATPLGRLLAGEIDTAQAARLSGRTEDEVRAALERFRI